MRYSLWKRVICSIHQSTFLFERKLINRAEVHLWTSNNLITTRVFHYRMMSSGNLEKAKKLAALRAVDEHVQDNQVVGIGSGSTVVYAVQRIAERVRAENLKLICVPTSFQAKHLIIENKLRLSDLDAHPQIDVTIDGCDECDEALNLVKGGGGCHLLEKIVASASKKLVIVADYTKESKFLGEKWKKGIPLEIGQIGFRSVINKLNKLANKHDCIDAKEPAQIRLATRKMGPVVTDNGNFIVDFQVGSLFETEVTPKDFDVELRKIPGVLETGLFVNMASQAYFGHDNGSVTTKLKPSK